MMENTDNEWKKQAPILAGLKKPAIQEPGEVYFSSLHTQLMQRLASAQEWEGDAELLASVEKPTLQMPETEYFREFPADVLEKSKQHAEWETEAPVLAALQKPAVTQPGDEYFNALPSVILSRIYKEEAPVVRLIPMIVRYAAVAACMAGTLWLYKGLIDSDFVPSLAVQKTMVYESDFNNMPELYNADELTLYLAEDAVAVPEKNPMVEELNEKLDSHDDLESLLEL